MILYMDLYSTTERKHSAVHLLAPVFCYSSAKSMNRNRGLLFFGVPTPFLTPSGVPTKNSLRTLATDLRKVNFVLHFL